MHQHRQTDTLSYESDTSPGIFCKALLSFKALWEFGWIGYLEMCADMVQAVLAAHPHLHGGMALASCEYSLSIQPDRH